MRAAWYMPPDTSAVSDLREGSVRRRRGFSGVSAVFGEFSVFGGPRSFADGQGRNRHR